MPRCDPPHCEREESFKPEPPRESLHLTMWWRRDTKTILQCFGDQGTSCAPFLPCFATWGCATAVPYTCRAIDVLFDRRYPNSFAPESSNIPPCVCVSEMESHYRGSQRQSTTLRRVRCGFSTALVDACWCLLVSAGAWTVGTDTSSVRLGRGWH